MRSDEPSIDHLRLARRITALTRTAERVARHDPAFDDDVSNGQETVT
jgi:hypothetical protein